MCCHALREIVCNVCCVGVVGQIEQAISSRVNSDVIFAFVIQLSVFSLLPPLHSVRLATLPELL
jgi:hypothetical protein